MTPGALTACWVRPDTDPAYPMRGMDTYQSDVRLFDPVYQGALCEMNYIA